MQPENLDLRKLRTFQLVAELGSLRRAALRLGITVSAVSLAIQRLETDLGVALFQRLPNKMVLTAAGERMVMAAESLFRDVGTALSTLDERPATRGRLTMAVSTDIGWYVAPALNRYMNKHPDVELSVSIHKSAEALSLISKGDIDIAIGRFRELEEADGTGSAYKSFEIATLVRTGFSLICLPGDVLASMTPDIAAISRRTVITLAHQNSVRRIIESPFLKSGPMPRRIIEAVTCQQIHRYVEQGLGVGIVHSICAAREHGPLRAISLDDYYGTIMFSALFRRASVGATARSPALEAMLMCLTEQCRTM